MKKRERKLEKEQQKRRKKTKKRKASSRITRIRDRVKKYRDIKTLEKRAIEIKWEIMRKIYSQTDRKNQWESRK